MQHFCKFFKIFNESQLYFIKNQWKVTKNNRWNFSLKISYNLKLKLSNNITLLFLYKIYIQTFAIQILSLYFDIFKTEYHDTYNYFKKF